MMYTSPSSQVSMKHREKAFHWCPPTLLSRLHVLPLPLSPLPPNRLHCRKPAPSHTCIKTELNVFLIYHFPVFPDAGNTDCPDPVSPQIRPGFHGIRGFRPRMSRLKPGKRPAYPVPYGPHPYGEQSGDRLGTVRCFSPISACVTKSALCPSYTVGLSALDHP